MKRVVKVSAKNPANSIQSMKVNIEVDFNYSTLAEGRRKKIEDLRNQVADLLRNYFNISEIRFR